MANLKPAEKQKRYRECLKASGKYDDYKVKHRAQARNVCG